MDVLNLFIHVLVEEYMNYFKFLAVIKKAALNSHIHVLYELKFIYLE